MCSCRDGYNLTVNGLNCTGMCSNNQSALISTDFVVAVIIQISMNVRVMLQSVMRMQCATTLKGALSAAVL